MLWLMTFLSRRYSNTFWLLFVLMFMMVPSFAALRASRSMRVYVCFLEHFEQFEHAGELLPGTGAVGAHLSLKPPIRTPADIEEKANRLPQRW
jgi:hypothetical protein